MKTDCSVVGEWIRQGWLELVGVGGLGWQGDGYPVAVPLSGKWKGA